MFHMKLVTSLKIYVKGAIHGGMASPRVSCVF